MSFHSLVDYQSDDENVVDDHDDGTIDDDNVDDDHDDDHNDERGNGKIEDKERFSDARSLASK